MIDRHPLMDLFDLLCTTLVEKVSAGIAAAMVTVPFWHSFVANFFVDPPLDWHTWLITASSEAALWAPIAGVCWLCIQIVAKIVETAVLIIRPSDDGDEE